MRFFADTGSIVGRQGRLKYLERIHQRYAGASREQKGRILYCLLLWVLMFPGAGPGATGDALGAELTLTSVEPQALLHDTATEITVTGTGFVPQTDLALVGGGIYEIGQLRPLGSVGLAISGDLTFVAGSALWVVDISNPASPRLIGQSGFLGFFGRGVAVAGEHAYVAGLSISAGRFSARRLRVVDVSNPSAPLLGEGLTTCSTSRVVATDPALYLACREGELLILDRANPAIPVIATSFAFGAGPKTGLALQEDRLLVVDEMAGLFILDIQNPFAPDILGREPDATGFGVTVDGHFAYVGGSREKGLQVVDIRNPIHPRLLGIAPTQFAIDDPVAANGFAFSGDSKKLWVHDVRAPRSPSVAYKIFIGTTIFDVERSGDLVAVGDQGAGTMRLFEVSRPEPPGLVKQMTGIGRVAPGLIVCALPWSLRVPWKLPCPRSR